MKSVILPIMGMVVLLGWLITGWLIGGIINWLADQLPLDQKLRKPTCSHCEARISWGRYIALETCTNCHHRRSVRSWIIQLGVPVLAMVLSILPPGRLPPIIGLVMLAYFLLVAVIDVEHRLILGPISQFGVVLGLLIGIYLHNILYTLIGGLAGAGIMWLLYLAGRLFSRFLSKRRGEPIDEEALGFGDVYVAAIIGLILGWPGITAGLLGAILLGGVISGLYLLAMLIAKRYHSNTALPYAPFLLLAVVLLLYYPK